MGRGYSGFVDVQRAERGEERVHGLQEGGGDGPGDTKGEEVERLTCFVGQVGEGAQEAVGFAGEGELEGVHAPRAGEERGIVARAAIEFEVGEEVRGEGTYCSAAQREVPIWGGREDDALEGGATGECGREGFDICGGEAVDGELQVQEAQKWAAECDGRQNFWRGGGEAFEVAWG